jgi:hypothetical protein
MAQDSELTALRAALFDAALLRSIVRTNVAVHFRRAVAALIRSTKLVEIIDGVVLVDGQDTDTAVGNWVASPARCAFSRIAFERTRPPAGGTGRLREHLERPSRCSWMTATMTKSISRRVLP